MKTFKTLVAAAFVIISQLGFAQTGTWNKAGNTLNGDEKLGSSNLKPVNFVTNNTTRMTLTANGSFGIGIKNPQSRLHVASGTSGITARANSTIVTESNNDNFIHILSPSTRTTGIAFGATVTPQAGGVFYNTSFVPNGFEFIVSSNSRMALANSGFLGIGIQSPKSQLHVVHAPSGVSTPLFSSSIITENNSNNFVNILAPNSSTSGVIFGNPQNNADGGVIYNSVETARGLQFNTGGNNTRMVVASSGFVGIGTKTPSAELHLVHSNGNNKINGLRIENGPAAKHWLFFADAEADLDLSANGQFKGFFSDDGGDYFSTSDARAKKDIVKAPDVMGKVLQLDVKQYHFLQEGASDNKHYGMLAQDVEKLFPEIVVHKTGNGEDRYLVNQSAYGVIAIKAIQELKGVIEKQQSDIEELKGIIKKLEVKDEQSSKTEASNNKLSLSGDKGAGLTSAKLFQNTPNPFNSQTTIRYYIPQLKGKATIAIFSSGGQLVKTYPVTGSGNGQISINAGELAAGTYQYVLSIDGVKVDAKQMAVIK